MSTAQRPNILYVLADDLGYGDVSCLNPESKIQTPRHDELAAQGMTFTDAHSNSAVCTPTRYGVLTGRYCFRSRLTKGVFGGYDDLLIEDGRMTVASMLKDQGYRTACIGKWHLGLGWVRSEDRVADRPKDDNWTEDPSVDYAQRLTAGPHTCGFDHSLIIPASLDIVPYCYIDNGRVVEAPTAHVEEAPRPVCYRGGPIAPGMEHETCLLEFTTRITQYIADHAERDDDQPFFMYAPLPSPHTPHLPRKPFQGQSDAGRYGDYVVEHDWSVGQMLDALERHGLSENTIVVVTSDNGAHMRANVHDDYFDFEKEFGHRSNHIYRGQKSDCWDGGHRVPFIVRWPGQVPAGSVCDQTVCLTDFLRTAAEVTGASVPADAAEDSFSILPMLRGDADAPDRPATVHHSITGEFAVRQGPWKYIENAGSGGWSQPSTEHALAGKLPPHQLYRMDEDPSEQNNLIDQHPEVRDQLQSLLDRFREDGRSVPA